MTREQMERINALARKKKAEGLTEEEALEQRSLRQQYIGEMRANLLEQLGYIYIENEDGQYEKLRKKD
ncbi:MAG: DUF896 domain-containing protein [Eubacteriales bacterium]|jgi:uncharacterized protein YnzC (UPF0291/DUF896 family)|nr:DUF896 domain-containing protein [Eubacteriales bacterium]MDD3110186.1 DUF896 domain-containing protein [Eubacteriales bacterium]MDD3571629.1 DUF896 domain-containing protein [Eubacteriales bacterium]MDD4133504.1 DUF896 domain-containing protein [Eubacteriales bacterium]NLO12922.1 DUF896 domain-containing protein [Clostridiales bacterium]